MEPTVRGGLTLRVVGATLILALVVGTAFILLLRAISAQRESAAHALESQLVLASSNRLQRLVLDLETGSRGYLLTGDATFLQPWGEARDAVGPESAILQERTQVPAQHQRAMQLAATVNSYVNDYSVPLIDAAVRGDPSAKSLATITEGKNRVDLIRTEFSDLETAEHDLAATRDLDSAMDAQRAVIAAGAGLGGSVLLILLLAGYLARSVVRPVRRVARMADLVAGGDLSARVPETGVGEIGTLERSFNEMGASLDRGRNELSRVVREQAALRRVATLVARGESPAAVFEAVVEEAGDVLGVEGAMLLRREADDNVTVISRWGPACRSFAEGTKLSAVNGNVTAEALRTGRAAWQDTFFGDEGSPGWVVAKEGVRLAVAAPILIEGRAWGVIDALSTHGHPAPAGIVARLAQFTDLVATAIANSQARADLAASRVRLVAASDQARRRIERDLHDGTQQRLVSLALDLRGAEAGIPDELPGVRDQLGKIAGGLAAALDDLREISRGIHPAILTEGGLTPALKALARRSSVPVELTSDINTRLPQALEAAAYYAVAEILTNAAKHARASAVEVEAHLADGRLEISVHDDGIGGADPDRGSGLTGLCDRIEALSGRITVHSPPGDGTRVRVELPVDTG